MSSFARQKVTSAELYAGMSNGSLSPAYVAQELQRQHVAARIEAVSRERRRQERARVYRYWASFWPIVLGVVLGYYAPALHQWAAGLAPWAATLLFPLSAVVAQRELHLSLATSQALGPMMIYAQMPLDGWLARRLLRPRPDVLSVCGQVTCYHALAVLYLGLITGSLAPIFAN